MNEKLNSLATAAKVSEGDMWKIKAHFSDFIAGVSDKIRNMIASQESFENECDRYVERIVEHYDPSRGNFEMLVRKAIWRTANKHKQRFADRASKVRVVPMYTINRDTQEEDEVPIIDALASVEVPVLVTEMIARLASDDQRDLVVLKLWRDGHFSASEISELLAQRFGGNKESHRKFIQRFKNRCKIALDLAV